MKTAITFLLVAIATISTAWGQCSPRDVIVLMWFSYARLSQVAVVMTTGVHVGLEMMTNDLQNGDAVLVNPEMSITYVERLDGHASSYLINGNKMYGYTRQISCK